MTFILARLLAPEDFGITAMATSFTALIEVAAAFGFDTPLIRDRERIRERYDTAWTLSLMTGLACAVAVMALAYPAAAFFREPRVVPVLIVLSIAWAIQSFENIGTVDFRRELRFGREFSFLAAKRLIAFACTLALAAVLRNYWALVGGIVAGRIGGCALSYLMSSYRPSFRLSETWRLLSFTSWLVANNWVSVALERASHFVVGRRAGAPALGLYAIAVEIAILPTWYLVSAVNRAVYPAYARAAQAADALKGSYLAVAGGILAVVLPATVGLILVAPEIVRVFLGEKWMAAVPLVQLLAVAGGFLSLGTNSAYGFLALGRPQTVLKLSVIRLAILLPLIIAGVLIDGVRGVAAAEAVGAMLFAPIGARVLMRVLQIRWREYLALAWRPVCGCLTLFAGVELLHVGGFLASVSPVLSLAIQVFVGVVAYVGTVLALWLGTGLPGGFEANLVRYLRARFAGPPAGGEHA